jgi:hypothetical protein
VRLMRNSSNVSLVVNKSGSCDTRPPFQPTHTHCTSLTAAPQPFTMWTSRATWTRGGVEMAERVDPIDAETGRWLAAQRVRYDPSRAHLERGMAPVEVVRLLDLIDELANRCRQSERFLVDAATLSQSIVRSPLSILWGDRRLPTRGIASSAQ